MNKKYYLFSFCNGELETEEEFEELKELKEYLEENKYLEDIIIIKGEKINVQ